LLSLTVGLQRAHFASANFFPEPAPQGIRIESDGSVNGTDKIQRDGATYTFTDDIEGIIVVLRNNIVIDGSGYTLQGNGNSTGVFLQDRVNVTVKDMKIRGFEYGIKLTWKNMETGSSNNTITGNTIIENNVGILLRLFTKNNFISDNVITKNSYGIIINHSPNNVLRGNQLKENQFNLWVYVETCVPASHYLNDIDTSNTVDGKPIYYWVNQQDKTVPSGAGYVALISCSRITVEDLVLSNNGQGVLLVATNNSLVTRNLLKNNGYGVVVYGPYEPCAGNTVTKNEIIGWTEKDIFVWSDLENSIYDNAITPTQSNQTIQPTPATPIPTPSTPTLTPEQSPSSLPPETDTKTEQTPFPTFLVATLMTTVFVGLGVWCIVKVKSKGTKQG